MKYLVTPYIALGLVLSMTIGIEYNCIGQEVFPTYYGSPFVFKQKSLGSSMEYYYSISGLVLNILTWSLILAVIDLVIKSLKRKVKWRWVGVSYRAIIGIFILFTTFNIVIDCVMIGHGFGEGLNYWYWDLSNKANEWGVICDGEIIALKKY